MGADESELRCGGPIYAQAPSTRQSQSFADREAVAGLRRGLEPVERGAEP